MGIIIISKYLHVYCCYYACASYPKAFELVLLVNLFSIWSKFFVTEVSHHLTKLRGKKSKSSL